MKLVVALLFLPCYLSVLLLPLRFDLGFVLVGGGKSLLFMAPACLEDAGVTIVVVPYRALINDLVAKATKVGIDSIEWRPGEPNPAALIFISADVVSSGNFMGYAQLLSMKGMLRRVFVDESHLTFTSSNWRPKLAHVREVRKLRCPTIMLTATLPVLLENELEEAMAAQLSRYIRATTTRRRTRYIVHKVIAGTLDKEVLGLCRRMKKHLGFRKGVVYCRSRDQCTTFADELTCAYYHAGAVDNEERLELWLTHGGLIVATSALGTGVDFPGVVFILHVDLPYGMIDFAQESGRAGRAGEDVDSVIIIEEGKVERSVAKMLGIDDTVMGEFVTTKSCRRAIMSTYLDGKTVECRDGLARCDNCGEGLTAIQNAYAHAAHEQEGFEQQMDKIVDSSACLACFVGSAFQGGMDWSHQQDQCLLGKSERLQIDETELDQFRSTIRFSKATHSCFKCGISQKLCRTGQDSLAKCQWPNIMISIVRRIGDREGGLEILRRAGFEGEWGEWGGYTRWLAERHRSRMWGEVMSNAMVVLKQFLEWRRVRIGEEELELGNAEGSRVGKEEARPIEVSSDQGAESDTDKWRIAIRQRRSRRVVEESEGKEEGSEATTDQEQWRLVVTKLREWDGVCLICKALHGFDERRHTFVECPSDYDVVAMMKAGAEQVKKMAAPRCEQGRCWAPWVRCVEDQGAQEGCKWSRLAGEVAMAVLYVGKEKEQAQEWVSKDSVFAEEVAVGQDGVVALERFFTQQREWKGVDGSMIGELIVHFA